MCHAGISVIAGLLLVLNVTLSLAASQPVCSLLQPGCVNTTEVDIKKTCRTSKLNNRQNGRVSLSHFFFIDHVAGEIIHLVASMCVRVSVCLWAQSCLNCLTFDLDLGHKGRLDLG